MSIFASTPPRNTDPFPWFVVLGPWRGTRSDARLVDSDYEPRPEFDQPRAHEANPILVAYRQHLAKQRITSDAGGWLFAIDTFAAFGGFRDWDSDTHPYYSLIVASDDQIEHARRVLSKLEAVTS